MEIDDEETGIVIELKYPEDGNLDAGCEEAMRHIEKKQYEEFLRDEGINHILKYGITYYKKRCKVILVEEW